MLVVDQLKRNDPALRLLAMLVGLGLVILFAGLYYIQIISYKHYAESGKGQTYRTVRIPAVRGKIVDRNGQAIAENRAVYNIVLYLDELRPLFREEYRKSMARLKTPAAPAPGFIKNAWVNFTGTIQNIFGSKPKNPSHSAARLQEKLMFDRQIRFRVASNLVQHVSDLLQMPIPFNEEDFHAHYERKKILPLPVLKDLTPVQLARFEEQPANPPGLSLEVIPTRIYPQGEGAAHMIGHLSREEIADENASIFDYRLQDYKGVIGLEGVFDEELRGKAGVKSVVVNRLGYRQKESVWIPSEPGRSLVLTIDLPLQQVAEKALKSTALGPEARAAAVVMDCRNGDLLAMVSNPAYDPNIFLKRLSMEDLEKLNDVVLRPQINRATQGIYQPGSIFKIISGLAALEAGVMTAQTVITNHGAYHLGNETILDRLAPTGEYDFRRAFLKSCNTYFIEFGLRAGLEKILDLGDRFYLGQKTDLPIMQNNGGIFPSMESIRLARQKGRLWTEGNTAHVCIGQEIAVTPMQMAVMTAAIANNGRILWPRLVQKIQSTDPMSREDATRTFPSRIRGELGVRPAHLQLIRQAMLDDVEDREGTGQKAFVPGFRVCGKTGTAEVTQGKKVVGQITWFVSFAPFENPRYAVVVMVENGTYGGQTCAPVAQKIYQEIHRRERMAEKQQQI